MLIDKLKNKAKELISFIMSAIVVTSFSITGDIKVFSISSILFLICVFYFLYNTKFDLKNDIKIKLNVFLSTLFTLVFVFGKCAYENTYDKNVDIIKTIFSLKSLLVFLGVFILIFAVLQHLLTYLVNLNLIENKSKTLKKYKIFLGAFAIILLCWIPYFMAYYPGVVTNDSFSELEAVVYNGITSDHHPVFHQLFILIFYKIGQIFFTSTNDIVAFINFIQMAIMALIFSYAICFLYNRNIKKFFLIAILAYFALYPSFAFHSCTMWKDVLFAGLLLLFILEIIKLFEKKECIKYKDLIMPFVVTLLMLLFRNNALYMYILLLPFLMIVFRKNIKKIILLVAMCLVVFFMIKGPIYKSFGIKKSGSSEYLAIPLQQIGRMAYKNVNFTDEEKSVINELLPIEIMEEVYDPTTVDNIKFHKEYNGKFFDNNKLLFFKTYVKLVIKYPTIAIESYLISTLGYWYPEVIPKGIWTFSSDNLNVCTNESIKIDEEIYSDSKVPSFVLNIMKKFTTCKLPLVSLQWSIGLVFGIILIFTSISFLKNGIESLITYLPIWGVWLTIMIATPVWAEYRYIFGAYTCLPVLICYPYICNIHREKRK